MNFLQKLRVWMIHTLIIILQETAYTFGRYRWTFLAN